MLLIRRSLLRSGTLTFAFFLNSVGVSNAVAQTDYGFDTSYSSLGFLFDAFSTINGTSARFGNRHVVVPGGEIVASGRIRLNADPVAPYWNIGLARYGRFLGNNEWNGTTGPYFWQDFNYVVYPNLQNGGSGLNRIESVDDIAYADGRLYVLVTRLFSTAPEDRDVSLVVFNEDGTLQQSLDVVGSNLNEYGRALDVKQTNLIAKPVSVTVLAERLAPGSRMVLAKYDLGSNGLLAPDSGFNGGVPLQVPINTSCQGSGQCNVTAGDLVRPTRLSGGDNMPIYAVGAVQRNGTDWDYVAVKIRADGTFDTAFGSGGMRYIPFDEPGSDRGDFAWSVTIDSGIFSGSDILYLAGNVPRSCRGGVGFAALREDGFDLDGFGTNGRIVQGGSTETGTICEQETTHYATQLVKQGNELALAGVAEGVDPGGNSITDGLLVRVDAGSGGLRGLSTFPVVDTSTGERLGRVRLWGISAYDDRQYVVSGEISDVQGAGNAFVTARLQPADRLFASGVDVIYPQQ